MKDPTFERATVAVIGLGLIGGSLVRALSRLPEHCRVLGASPDEKDRAGAARESGVTVVADGADVVGEADLVVYAVPMGVTIDLLAAHASRVRPDTIVTDVAGLKRPVLAAARAAGLGDRYIGSHPMAGGEGTGFDCGRPDLFENAAVWLCADQPLDPSRSVRLAQFWRAVGARPQWTDPDAHDRLMVQVSHLPQLVSNALALALESAGVDPQDLSPGGRDMTRLAASPSRMWSDLLAYTAPEAARMLREVGVQIDELVKHLEAGDLDAVARAMKRTRQWRSDR